MTSDFFKRGKCRWCEDINDGVYRDTHLCESCDSNTVWCGVCRERMADDGCSFKCRHVFRDRYGEWSGAGVQHSTDATKEGFIALVKAMPDGFSENLRAAIKTRKFYTWIVAPMIGGGGMLEINGMPYDVGRSYGNAMIKLGERDDETAEITADGYRWLASHYQGQTGWANRRTLAWLGDIRMGRA